MGRIISITYDSENHRIIGLDKFDLLYIFNEVEQKWYKYPDPSAGTKKEVANPYMHW